MQRQISPFPCTFFCAFCRKQGFQMEFWACFIEGATVYSFQEKRGSQGGEKRHQSYSERVGGGKGNKSLCFEWNKQTHAKSRAKISPEQQLKSMLMCGDKRSFCHVKTKKKPQQVKREAVCPSTVLAYAAQQWVSACTDRLMLLESLASLSWSTWGQSFVCSQRTFCNILPWMEMDLDSVMFSMLRQ